MTAGSSWQGWLLALAFAIGCGGPQSLGSAGTKCYRDDDCVAGLICVKPEGKTTRVCSNDPTPIISMVDGPPTAGSAGVAAAMGGAGAAAGGRPAAGSGSGGAGAPSATGGTGAAGAATAGTDPGTAGTDPGTAGTDPGTAGSSGTSSDAGAPP